MSTMRLLACLVKSERGGSYPSKHEAEKVLKDMQRRHKGRRRLQAYKCQFCGKYHIGNASPGKGMRRK